MRRQVARREMSRGDGKFRAILSTRLLLSFRKAIYISIIKRDACELHSDVVPKCAQNCANARVVALCCKLYQLIQLIWSYNLRI